MIVETKKRKYSGQLFLIALSVLMIAYSVLLSFEAKTLILKGAIALNTVFYCAILLISCDAIPFYKIGGDDEQ